MDQVSKLKRIIERDAASVKNEAIRLIVSSGFGDNPPFCFRFFSRDKQNLATGSCPGELPKLASQLTKEIRRLKVSTLHLHRSPGEEGNRLTNRQFRLVREALEHLFQTPAE